MTTHRTLIALAAGISFAWPGLVRAERPASSTYPRPASAALGREPDAWGNSPAAQGSVRLVQPQAPQHPVTPDKPQAAKPLTAHPTVSSHPAHRATKEPVCSNLPAKLDRGQALAETGRAEQAYGVYLELLRACIDPGELSATAWNAAKALPPADVDRLIADPVFDKPSLEQVRNDLRLQRMYAENDAGHDANALAYSRALRADPSVHLDASALEVSGWLEARAHDDKAAEALFREALKTTKDPSSARLGLTLSLMHQQRLAEADAESRELTTQQGMRLHAAIELALAKESHDPAQVDAALRRVEETGDATDPATRALAGWALLNSGRPAQAEQIFSQLHESAPGNDEYMQGLVFAAAANRDYERLGTLVNGSPGNIPPIARQTLADHDERLGLYDRARALTGHPSEGQEPSLQSLFTLDRKSGTAGQDKLTVWTIPQLSVTMLASASLTLRIDGTALRLDDGVRHAWGKQLGATVRTEVGQGVLVAGAALEKPGEGPLQALGRIQYQRIADSEDEFLRLTLSRDSIYDSLRAFEGVPSSGIGPAISSSLELAARQAIGRSAFHFGETLSGGAVTASGTAANPFYAVSVSLTRDFRLKGWSWLNAGPEIRLSSYRYDANRFDGSYGGYWSPKSNREAGLVFYAQSDEGGRFLFKTGGRVGYATRELFTGHASGAFGEDTATIAGLLAPRLIVGTGIGYRASPGYHDMSVFAWLKIPFEARGHLRAADLATPRGF
jgi:tetratricopeptide (TPR) repeat protein